MYFSSTKTGDDLKIRLFSSASTGVVPVIAEGTSDISGIDDGPVLIELAEVSSSGISGIVWVHSWVSDVERVPLLVSLVLDYDIDLIYSGSDEDHMDGAYSDTDGYARYCAMATTFILRLVSNLYKDQLGGFGNREAVQLTDPDRLEPDLRGLSSPNQLKDAAIFYACWMAFMAQSQSDGSDDMLVFKAEQCKEQYEDAKSAWNLAINTDPDEDEDADLSKGASSKQMTRV
jgi:hypothetical protein